ncbi:tetratricopeptide repeat protein, partial [Stenotrophomonas sp. HMWF003]|uniref:tetratricopeptide repeat protein n=1 Tax=Stenotrophomonas sp. HMWF003 TaxID=2056840 RepID=UPI002159E3A0
MSGSWLPTIAAMVATAVGLVVLWPLRAAGRRAPFIVMVVAVGVAGSALYYLVGTPEAAAPTARTGEPASLREGVVELERALERDPQRADGWALLGRSQQALGNLAEANRAFARAVQLAPDEPELLVEAAQTRAQADPAKQFDDTALQWLRHAQRLAPGSERAGWLIGIAQRQRGQDAEAAATWEALLPRLDPGAATALREQIAIAREKAGLPAAAAPSAAATAAPAPALTVTVAL